MATKTECKARLLSGNEACVYGAIAAGVRFFAGYPITPSTEIAEGLAEELPKFGGKFIQMEDGDRQHGCCNRCLLSRSQSYDCHFRPGFSLKQGEHRLCGPD